MNRRTFHGVLVSKNSDLYKALSEGKTKEAEKIFKETNERYKKLYSEEDRAWFQMMMEKHGKDKSHA